MSMKWLSIVAAVGVALTATSVLASPINPTNVRPVVIGPSAVSSEPSLQSMLDNIYGCTGCVNAATGQQTAGMWSLVGGLPVVTSPILHFEAAGNAPFNSFGIWSGTDSTALTTVPIFNGPATPGTVATLSWLTENHVTITGGAGVNTGTFAGIDRNGFGFYLNGPGSGSGNFYSADQLNPGGVAQMLAYVNPVNDRWVFAFEDVLQGDRDFNDLVVATESIQPTPEPASILLLGSAMVSLSYAVRRRMKK